MTQAAAAQTRSRAPEALAAEEIDELRRAFAERGYVVLPGLVPPEQVDRTRDATLAAFDRAQSSGELFSGGGLLTGHLNCFPGGSARAIYDTLGSRGVVSLIKQLFPRAVRLPNVGCNLNLPGSVEQHYHADRPFTNDFIICNVALVDTDVANGAIDVLPGTHARFHPFWRFALSRTWRLSTRVEMKAGDVLIRTSNLWHRGMPNRTGLPRPMLAFTWEDGGCVRDDPFSGEVAFYPNWFRTTALGRLRERTFLAAPISYSAYRFVRSLFGTKGYDH